MYNTYFPAISEYLSHLCRVLCFTKHPKHATEKCLFKVIMTLSVLIVGLLWSQWCKVVSVMKNLVTSIMPLELLYDFGLLKLKVIQIMGSWWAGA